jgi:hypothetical protein
MDFTAPEAGTQSVSRYLTRRKFESRLRLQAMWFCALGALQDEFEGTLPKLAFERLHRSHLETANHFPGNEWQFAEMAARQTQDLRQMMAVNCWCIGSTESDRMWQEYAPGADSVMIASTIAQIDAAFAVGDSGSSLLGQVRYVDFDSFEMPIHEAANSAKVIFLKQERFEHESELRISVLNVVAPGRLNPDETPCSLAQARGIGQFEPYRRGVFIPCILRTLITSVHLSPLATAGSRAAVGTLLRQHGLHFIPVVESAMRPH